MASSNQLEFNVVQFMVDSMTETMMCKLHDGSPGLRVVKDDDED